jgi:hypothetical protein
LIRSGNVNVAGKIAAAEISAALLGKRCWYAYVGVGCTFSMDLGRRLLRDRPLTHRQHPPEYRKYEGESSLLVWCSWRVESARGPLASSDNEFDLCQEAIRRLIGRSVEDVRIEPGWSLRLALSSGLVVSVFADHVGPKAIFDGNWELWRPEQAYVIGTDLTCQILDRQYRPVPLPSPRRRWKSAAKAGAGR